MIHHFIVFLYIDSFRATLCWHGTRAGRSTWGMLRPGFPCRGSPGWACLLHGPGGNHQTERLIHPRTAGLEMADRIPGWSRVRQSRTVRTVKWSGRRQGTRTPKC